MIDKARIPIVKFVDPKTGINCDICVNNTLALENTKLLKEYSLLDDRFVQMSLFIKHWSKSRLLNEPYHGTLSSYAFVLLIVHFLQNLKEPILPRLDKKLDSSLKNEHSIGWLIASFFKYYSYDFDIENDVVSIKHSHLSKKDLNWTDDEQRYFLSIEDPFEEGFNVGRTLAEECVETLKYEFTRSYILIREKKDIKTLCLKIKK